MTSLGARLIFSRPGATPVSATPAVPGKPHVIAINGREFQITSVRMKIDGTWKDIDIKTLSSAELGELTDRCKKIFDKTKPTTNQISKLSFFFEQNTETESFLSRTVGIFWSRFKNPPTAMNLQKIVFHSEGADEAEVYKLEDLDETAKAKLQSDFKEDLQGVNQIANMLFFKEHTKQKPKKNAIEQSPLHQVIADSIKDAGSDENRCAALSLAKNELAKKTPIKTIADKYRLPAEFTDQWHTAIGPEAQIKRLADALIQKAASVIESDHAFRNPDIQNQQQPCLAVIENALNEHKRAHADFVIGRTPAEKTEQYANLIRQPGVMLDLPFFLALEQPFMIIQKTQDNTNYAIRVIGHLVNIPGKIEDCDLDNVNIVYYNGSNHYQSIILAGDQHKAAMRQLIRKDITAQVDALSDRLSTKDRENNELEKESQDYQDLIRLYPAARDEILQKLKITGDNLQLLRSVKTKEFTTTLRNSIHGKSQMDDID